MNFPLAAPTFENDELEALTQVIDSGYFTMGEKVAQFETEFAAYHQRKYAVMVNSGSSANLLAVAAYFFKADNPLKAGDEVIVPAVAWATTYHPLQQYGLKLKIVDIDINTLNVDIQQLEAAITDKTKLIVGVSILGNPARLDAMQRLAKQHNLYFMEDNCESLDAELNGTKTGTFGERSTFSFFFSHHISTMEGGMILTDDQETYHLCRSLRAHGWTRDLPEESSLYQRTDDDLFEAYRFILPGYNVRPTELNAAVGLIQLQKLAHMTDMRRKNLKLFHQLFGDDSRFIIQKEVGKSSAFSFTFIVNPAACTETFNRKTVFAALKEADIGFRMITGGNILRHDVIQHYQYETQGKIIHADIMHDNGFFVGNHPFDLREQLMKLSAVLEGADK